MTERLEFELTLDGIQAAQAQLDKFKNTVSATETVVSKIDKEIKNTERDIKALQAAIASGTGNIDQYKAALNRLEGAKRNVGQAALEVSRGVEDMQYGFNGIVNNIPSLVMSLGGGAGLTAAISLAAVGMNQLIKHMGDFQTEAQKAKKDASNLKDEMNALHGVTQRGMTESLDKTKGLIERLREQANAIGKKGYEVDLQKIDEEIKRTNAEIQETKTGAIETKKILETETEKLKKLQEAHEQRFQKTKGKGYVTFAQAESQKEIDALKLVLDTNKKILEVAEVGATAKEMQVEQQRKEREEAEKLVKLLKESEKEKKGTVNDDDSLFNKLQNDRLKDSARIQAEADRRAYSQYETEVKRLDILNAFVEKKFGEKSLGEDIQDIMNRSAEMEDR
jgi:chromosome segregation ATPase